MSSDLPSRNSFKTIEEELVQTRANLVGMTDRYIKGHDALNEIKKLALSCYDPKHVDEASSDKMAFTLGMILGTTMKALDE